MQKKGLRKQNKGGFKLSWKIKLRSRRKLLGDLKGEMVQREKEETSCVTVQRTEEGGH